MADEAARKYGLLDAAALTQASLKAAEIIRQHHDIVDANRQAIADGTTGFSLPRTAR